MNDYRFWEEKTPEWRKEIEVEGHKCAATGYVFMRYPIYESPDLAGKLRRFWRDRLFSRPWQPLRKYDRYSFPQWIQAKKQFGRHRIELLIISPDEARKLKFRMARTTI